MTKLWLKFSVVKISDTCTIYTIVYFCGGGSMQVDLCPSFLKTYMICTVLYSIFKIYMTMLYVFTYWKLHALSPLSIQYTLDHT